MPVSMKEVQLNKMHSAHVRSSAKSINAVQGNKALKPKVWLSQCSAFRQNECHKPTTVCLVALPSATW